MAKNSKESTRKTERDSLKGWDLKKMVGAVGFEPTTSTV